MVGLPVLVELTFGSLGDGDPLKRKENSLKCQNIKRSKLIIFPVFLFHIAQRVLNLRSDFFYP